MEQTTADIHETVPADVIVRLVSYFTEEQRNSSASVQQQNLLCQQKVSQALGISLQAVQLALTSEKKTKKDVFKKQHVQNYNTNSSLASVDGDSSSSSKGNIKELILATLETLTAGKSPVNLPNLQARLGQQGVRMSRLTLLRHLRSLGYTLVGKGKHSFTGFRRTRRKVGYRWRKQSNGAAGQHGQTYPLRSHSSTRSDVFVDMIDTIQSFKCKFCQETFPSVQLTWQHIQATHIVQNTVSKKETVVSNVDHEKNVACDAIDSVKLEFPHPISDTVDTSDSGNTEGRNSPEDADMESLINVLQETAEHSEETLQASEYIIDAKIEAHVIENCSVGKENVADKTGGQEQNSASLGTKKNEPIENLVGSGFKKETLLGKGKHKLKHIGGAEQEFVCGVCEMVFTTIEKCIGHLTQSHEPQKDGQYVASVKERGRPSEKKSSEGISGKHQAENSNEKDVLEINSSDDLLKNSTSVKRELDEDSFGTSSKSRCISQGPHRKTHRRNGQDKRLSCACGARFTSKSNLDYHKLCHVTNTESAMPKMKYCCPECQKMFETWVILRRHLWRLHNIGLELLQCPQCVYLTDNKSSYDDHVRTHALIRNYVCDVCSKAFRQKHALLKHKKMHSEPKSHTCQRCGTSFTSIQGLRKHIMAVHEKLRPHLCPFCAHTTTRKESLDIHIQTHSKDKPYKCEKCDFACRDRNSLRRHKRRHEITKPYLCQFCTYSCIQSTQLKGHIQLHHPERGALFVCSYCPYSTINKGYFVTHTQSHKDESGSLFVDAKLPLTKVKKIHQRSSPARKKVPSIIETEEVEVVVPQVEQNVEPMLLFPSHSHYAHQEDGSSLHHVNIVKQGVSTEEIGVPLPIDQVEDVIVPENVPHEQTVEVVETSEETHIINPTDTNDHNVQHVQLVEISHGNMTTQVQLPVVENVDPVQLLFTALSALQ